MSAAAPLLMRRTLRGLEPDNELARQAMTKVKLNEVVRVDFRRPRSIQWHRRYWALVSLIADNTEHYTADDIHALLKLRCGCSRPIAERNGNVVWVPDSIAFDRMQAEEWATYWDRVVGYVCTELLPGVSKAVLEREIRDLVGMPPA